MMGRFAGWAVGKSPFARGCRFVVEFPAEDASTRQLRFPLNCSL
ncbi:MAG: hypothetical protein ACK4ME_11685 [Fimbriimonadales bacterium]